jgi:hypothetical protein
MVRAEPQTQELTTDMTHSSRLRLAIKKTFHHMVERFFGFGR